MIEREETEPTTVSTETPAPDSYSSDASDAGTATPRHSPHDYHNRGYSIIPIRPRTKSPSCEWKRYQTSRASKEELDNWFSSNRRASVGIVTGSVSGGLVDIDLDCPEACALAPSFLPPTAMTHGRESNKKSHYWYDAAPVPNYESYESPTGEMLVEVRSDGHYTVVPPSIHESGEEMVWHSYGRPSTCDGQALVTAARQLAACALLAKSWPKKGSRQHCALAAAGMILRGGRTKEFATLFVTAAARVAGDEEIEQRKHAVESTAQTLAANSPATGHPTLASFIGEDKASKIASWLELDSSAASNTPAASNQTSELLQLASIVVLSHTEDRVAYASYPCNGHTETRQIDDPEFEEWLTHKYRKSRGTVPNSESVKRALVAMRAEARIEGETCNVYIRVGKHEDKIYFDLADKDRRVVEIDASGWSIPASVPVKFERPRGVLPCPEPRRGGSVELIRQCLNIQDDDMFKLVVGFLLRALSPDGPFPVAVFKGQQGSGKSLNTRILRSLIDPAKPAMVSKPKGDQNLMIQASNSHVLCFDNLSGISNECSDSLCTISTGGGSRVRALWTNTGEVLIDVSRPQIINGIDNIVRRGDLLERSIVFDLPRISPSNRKTEKEILQTFESVRGLVLGALFDALSAILANIGSVSVPELPRMADFVEWVSAAEQCLGWDSGSFLRAFNANATGANDCVLDDSHVAAAVFSFVRDEGSPWCGTASELLDLFDAYRPEDRSRAPRWPKTPAQLSSELSRVAPALSIAGIDVEIGKATVGDKKRYIKIGVSGVSGVTSVTAEESIPSPSPEPRNTGAGLRRHGDAGDAGDVRSGKRGFLKNLSERELMDLAKAEIDRI